MLGKKKKERKCFYYLNIEDLVAEYNIYRKVNKVLPDLSFLHKEPEIQALYGTTGPPSIDPVVFFRIELIGLFENILSDRKLASHIVDSVSARWFIRYDIDEPPPVHSTISRTRKKYPKSLYNKIFTVILNKCVEAGLVGGKYQSQDTSLIKANASKESLEVKKPKLTIMERYDKAIAENSLSNESKQIKQRSLKTNEKYEHKYEKDAKIVGKKGTKSDMHYKGNIIVDSEYQVITQSNVEKADCGDSEIMLKQMEQIVNSIRFVGLEIESLTGDRGFFSGAVLQQGKKLGIDIYVPQQKYYGNSKEIKRKEFKYNKSKDEYICPAGNILKYKTFKDKKYRIYQCKAKECANCKLRSKCTDAKHGRQIKWSIYKEVVEELQERLKKPIAKQVFKYRKIGAEGGFANLKNELGLRKFLVHGLEQVNKKFIMGTVAYNLKKLIKYSGKPLNRKVIINKICNKTNDIALILSQFKKFLLKCFNFYTNKMKIVFWVGKKELMQQPLHA